MDVVYFRAIYDLLKVVQSHCTSSLESHTGQGTVLKTPVIPRTAGDVDVVLSFNPRNTVNSRLLFSSVLSAGSWCLGKGQSVPDRGNKMSRA